MGRPCWCKSRMGQSSDLPAHSTPSMGFLRASPREVEAKTRCEASPKGAPWTAGNNLGKQA